jgi:hypothetical protein
MKAMMQRISLATWVSALAMGAWEMGEMYDRPNLAGNS